MKNVEKISLIIPIYNEAQGLEEIFKKINDALGGIGLINEIIAVNDGSTDNSLDILKTISRSNRNIKIISFSRNFGQTAALSAGIDHATGDLIIPIDADLENDPVDIKRLLEKINEGYDVVSGWRKDRWQNNFFGRKVPSIIANWLISKITGIELHDYGCTFKAYRREVIDQVKLYGEMHRFIAAYASWGNAKVTEIAVGYRPRQFGKSNYGLMRIYKVLLDLLLIKFLEKYMNRPIHFFGGWGIVSLILGFISGFSAIILKITGLRDFVSTPLPTLTVFLVLVGFQMIAVGIIAEILMRTYYESQGKRPYTIKETINF